MKGRHRADPQWSLLERMMLIACPVLAGAAVWAGLTR